MVLKVLLLNLPPNEVPRRTIHEGVEITNATFINCPTTHDFHVLILDTSEVLNAQYWQKSQLGHIDSYSHALTYFTHFSERIGEQVRTGGITFCFSSARQEKNFSSTSYKIDNYFFCPVDLGIVNEEGDTFYPKPQELGYFNSLLRTVPTGEIKWTCYFSKTPPGAKVLGTNRAAYPIFMEVGIGAGKLVMLPIFKDRSKAIITIINEIVPQMIQEEQVEFRPLWVVDFSSPYEKQVRSSLKEIDMTKRLLYTKDKMLKKVVAFALEKLGLSVEILPDGTLPDLRISDGEQKAVVEVKGHENRQADRKDVLQLLGYMSEEDTKEKGVFIANHEFDTTPSERNRKAFTEGAIQLGGTTNISLVSSADLYELVMEVLQNKLDEQKIQEKRKKIMTTSGLTSLS